MTIAPATLAPSPRVTKTGAPPSVESLLDAFLLLHSELESYKCVPAPLLSPSVVLTSSTRRVARNQSFSITTSHRSGTPVKVDGHTLSIAAIVAAARYGASVTLDTSDATYSGVSQSRDIIQSKLDAGHSVYGLSTGTSGSFVPIHQLTGSTGFGGSADTRTQHSLVLGKSLLQHQHYGVLPIPEKPLSVLPLTDPITGFSMPEPWVRAAILIRMNSLIRGHSGVRWEFIDALGELLRENIIPVVPLRGSISSSGGKTSWDLFGYPNTELPK